jgi:hypothetical protein
VAPSEVKNLIFEDTIRSNITAFALDKYDHYILEKVLDVGNPMNMLYKERSFRPQAMDLRKNLLDERPILPRLVCFKGVLEVHRSFRKRIKITFSVIRIIHP